MAKLIYITNASLDGFIEDAHVSFDWTEPSDEVYAFITDLIRPVGTWLYERRLYEIMAVWETDATLAAQSEPMADFAKVWQTADKVVYSTTLREVSTAGSRLERSFDPEAVRDMKRSESGDLAVGGANLAVHAFKVEQPVLTCGINNVCRGRQRSRKQLRVRDRVGSKFSRLPNCPRDGALFSIHHPPGDKSASRAPSAVRLGHLRTSTSPARSRLCTRGHH